MLSEKTIGHLVGITGPSHSMQSRPVPAHPAADDVLMITGRASRADLPSVLHASQGLPRGSPVSPWLARYGQLGSRLTYGSTGLTPADSQPPAADQD